MHLGFDLLRELGYLREAVDRLVEVAAAVRIRLERNILRIGIYELEEGTVPAEVAINEAVLLAKRYATEDAARLVNGILSRVMRETT